MSLSHPQSKSKHFIILINTNSLFDKLSIQNEESIDVYYQFSLDKPKPTHSVPQEEWISTIKSLSHVMNEKAKTYVVGFFNGDLKVFSKNDH